MDNNKKSNIVIYGGNGFVGCKVAEYLQLAGAQVYCVSRKGDMPTHLHDENWAQNVRWLSGDASNADPTLLAKADVLVCLVGSPPIPALTKQGYDKQVFNNGHTNRKAIESAEQAGITRVVLLGAKLPALLQGNWFGYAKGKKISFNAAHAFAKSSVQHSATVIQPGAIFGKRHTSNGKEIPLDWVMRPLSWLLPSQFIAVEHVAKCIADACVNADESQISFKQIPHTQITKPVH